ncbi:Mitochondrial folate transporter/carrier [Apis cerana cerana]|uniref:Mitochondrial folate transporter/carrier n=1 Tax=Apis cerana cerana TaxID=94128 RepID=A0A2A3EQV5_APICC|nr:Mitochondrial folate transporter/carrier [Apis cerana cerana]
MNVAKFAVESGTRFEGGNGFYKGLSANLTRVTPATVITFVKCIVKEARCSFKNVDSIIMFMFQLNQSTQRCKNLVFLRDSLSDDRPRTVPNYEDCV